MIREIIGGLSHANDEPSALYLALAVILALIPLQTYLGLALYRRSTAGTSFWQCFFAISSAKFHKIKEAEPAEFRAAVKIYQRAYIIVMLPIFALVFGVYVWLKAW
jgi:hypothetical protein